MSTITLATTVSAPSYSAPSHRAGALLTTARPRQWVKNGLVLAAPAAAGTLASPTVDFQAIWAMVALVLASAAP